MTDKYNVSQVIIDARNKWFEANSKEAIEQEVWKRLEESKEEAVRTFLGYEKDHRGKWRISDSYFDKWNLLHDNLENFMVKKLTEHGFEKEVNKLFDRIGKYKLLDTDVERKIKRTIDDIGKKYVWDEVTKRINFKIDTELQMVVNKALEESKTELENYIKLENLLEDK